MQIPTKHITSAISDEQAWALIHEGWNHADHDARMRKADEGRWVAVQAGGRVRYDADIGGFVWAKGET